MNTKELHGIKFVERPHQSLESQGWVHSGEFNERRGYFGPQSWKVYTNSACPDIQVHHYGEYETAIVKDGRTIYAVTNYHDINRSIEWALAGFPQHKRQ